MKKLIEIEYNESWVSEQDIRDKLGGLVWDIKFYKNKEKLCVDEASKQCLDCPAYFVQENSE